MTSGDTLVLTPGDANTEGPVPVSAEDSAWNAKPAALRVPFTMPSTQTYYWRAKWQQAEREALAELDAGDSVEFNSDDPDDAAGWLEAPEE